MYDTKLTAKQVTFDSTITDCPFCHSNDTWLWEETRLGFYFVGCARCGSSGPHQSTKKIAVDSWKLEKNDNYNEPRV